MIKYRCSQINPTVGDFQRNTEIILSCITKAKTDGIDLLIFPSFSISGVPPEGLLLNKQFIKNNLECLKEISKATDNISVIIGFIEEDHGLYNAAALIEDEKILGISHKAHLSNKYCFDETRYFHVGNGPLCIRIHGCNLILTIGDDAHNISESQHSLDWILHINIDAYPFSQISLYKRDQILTDISAANHYPVLFSNLVGGQDGLVFSGCSFATDSTGTVIDRAKEFEEDSISGEINLIDNKTLKNTIIESTSKKPSTSPLPATYSENLDISILRKSEITDRLSEDESLVRALVTGVKDYVNKNGFQKVILGLSGGIDSSLVATIASIAIGSKNVIGLYMPSQYSSNDSERDVKLLTDNLNIDLSTISIEEVYKSFSGILSFMNITDNPGITEQNIQARIRANILYAFSNKFGYLVLSCGNKSELSVGYGTLYGDMAGGFSLLKDVYKTTVYQLAKFINKNVHADLIPANILIKEPSAELAPDQKDTDSLPPYDILDPILEAYIDQHKTTPEIINAGFDKDTVMRVVQLIKRSEHKRRQSPPGLILSSQVLNFQSRLPITNLFTDEDYIRRNNI